MLPTAALNAAEELLARAARAPKQNPIVSAPAPATEHYLEGGTAMSNETRPLRSMSHEAIAEILYTPGHEQWQLAFAEFSAQNAHIHTLKTKNQRIVREALEFADKLIPVPTPAPEAAPAPEPEVDPAVVKAAARSFEKRVKALAPNGERVRLSIRARKLAFHEGFTPEDVESLTDEEILPLVAAPII
jgi:hypothetical protein